jgi:hypothetical protein
MEASSKLAIYSELMRRGGVMANYATLLRDHVTLKCGSISDNLAPKLERPCVSVCESGAPNFARICWGERIFRGKVHGTCFPPAEPGFIAQQASHLSAASRDFPLRSR